MSLSPGREHHWRRRGGLLRREKLRREGENRESLAEMAAALLDDAQSR
jgi:hypothetical protein